MTTPKSPEQIMEEFVRSKTKIEHVMKTTEEIAWLRSSMASLLLWASEQMSKHKEGEGRWCDTGEDMDWECRSECMESARSLLKEKADEIIKS